MSDLLIGGGCCNPRIPKREQKIIIFDSPDGTGKTNIAQALSMDLKIPYFRMDTQHQNWRKGKFKEALEFDQPYLAEFIRQTHSNVIIDRAYPAEWVYSRVFDRPTNDEVLEQIDLAFARMGAYIVIPVRHDYSKARKDDLVDKKHLPLLHETYMEFARWSRCTTITIYVDAFGNDLKKEIAALKEDLDFGNDMGWKWNKVLGGELPSGRDVKEIFKEVNSELRGSELKKSRP